MAWRFQLMVQDVVLTLQPDPVKTTGNRIEKLVGAKRLEHEIDGARPQGTDRGVQVGIGRHQDDIGEEPDGSLFGKPIQAVLSRHDIVENDHVEVLLVEFLGRLFGVRGFGYQLAARPQDLDQEIAHPRLVVDDQDRGLGQPRPELWICGRAGSIVSGILGHQHFLPNRTLA